MRKKLITPGSIILAAFLLFSGCKKQIDEPQASSTAEKQAESQLKKGHDDGDGNECRLVTFDWPTAAIWQFQYNNKGLADKWTIDYGYGQPLHTNAMTYDRNNRLVKSIEDYFGAVYEYRFYYSGDRLTRLTRINVDFPDDVGDLRYTYNRKGQNIRQDDDTHDQHVRMYYDDLGNCTKTDVYFGTDLWYSDNYTFNAPVKNPRNNIPGVETGFPFYGTGGLPDKRFFTSNRTVIYDVDGTPFVFNDYDPSRTVIRTDNHHLPVSANYYDRITESSINITFGYDNCDGHHGGDHHDNNGFTTPSANKSVSPDKIRNQVMRILHGRVKDMKEQLMELRKQIRKQKTLQ